MWNGNYFVVIEMIPLKKSPQTTLGATFGTTLLPVAEGDGRPG